MTSSRLCSGTTAFTASFLKVRERPWDDYRARGKAGLSKRVGGWWVEPERCLVVVT